VRVGRIVFSDQPLARVEPSRRRHGDLARAEAASRGASVAAFDQAAETRRLRVEPADAEAGPLASGSAGARLDAGQTFEPRGGGVLDCPFQSPNVRARPLGPEVERGVDAFEA
jgi:hypothetical protein